MVKVKSLDEVDIHQLAEISNIVFNETNDIIFNDPQFCKLSPEMRDKRLRQMREDIIQRELEKMSLG